MNATLWKTKAKGLANDIEHLIGELRAKNEQLSEYERTVRRQSIWIVVLLLVIAGSWMLFLWG